MILFNTLNILHLIKNLEVILVHLQDKWERVFQILLTKFLNYDLKCCFLFLFLPVPPFCKEAHQPP